MVTSFRSEEHEKSMAHRNCAEAYFLNCSKADIKNLLGGRQLTEHRNQVKKRRQVLERVVEVIKVIGKRGLSYRQVENEAAYTLDNDGLDHGNFLELIILLGKYDVCLKEHLSNVIEKSKKLHVSPESRGRGSLISLLSKTTVNSVIDTIRNLIQQNISTEIRKAGMFSVQLDTTQDITAQDQYSVILRYVTDVVNERLVAVVRCSASTGQSFVDLLKEVLEHLKLDSSLCIGNATDGASNMQGHYRGFSALLASQSPNHVHVWCYSHVLNLVLSDTTQIVIESGSLFDLLNDTAVFIRESYQRVNIWEKESHDKRHRRIAPIGETRWWAKHDALNKIFGSFGKPQDSLYIDVLSTLTAIQELKTVKGNVRTKARGYKEGLLRYETILTAQLFLRIFEHTSPLSKYLQREGMDILSAHRMVMSTHDALKKMARDFQAVKAAADDFVKWANEKLEQQDEETDMEVEAALPQKRRKKKKAMPGEMSQDDTIIDAERAYEVKVHNQIVDTAIEAIHQRFLTHGTLYADLSFLDPKNFSLIRNHALPKSALEDLSKCLAKVDDRATVDNLQYELKSLAGQWDKLKESPLDEYVTRTVEDGPDGKEEDMEIINKSCASCKDCPLCCYQILQRFNKLTDAYPLLGLAYKFLLTLSITQVACERSFSTLKYIKSRLRSSLSASKLEAFMLMATEKDIFVALDTDTVIDRVAEKSKLLRKLLLL
uniref:HAT C-terminal dimerisation domain-containing protein n=1 Tax=Paramormyrops kingsleyae TaxID=1676925 RepID=A0A3B3S3W6_9TELE